MRMKRMSGFTLIELMIVVAIIAILTSIAYPSYKNSVMKGRRSDAQQLLLNAVLREEQYLLDARQYTTDFTALGITKDGWTCVAASCTNNFYTTTIAVDNSAAPPTYTVTATAKADQLADGNLTINSQGAKTPADKW